MITFVNKNWTTKKKFEYYRKPSTIKSHQKPLTNDLEKFVWFSDYKGDNSLSYLTHSTCVTKEPSTRI